ncbi:MAG: hypothetical protein DME49_00145 [Verrucomicrobia bacterium]|nr:MAG: hypothetical protein DME49_00145 [Verrucomicrobiota bacterium]
MYWPPPGNPTKLFGAPAGGNVEPSRSAGKKGETEPPRGPAGLMKVAGEPASIAVRLNANGCGPR